ncbi:Hypothetical protein, putative [Bodo saltans]|uniref:Uncharacterized protein n=1 Tax=Bodo saltans TaxID=75058 RepID=A0A0S4IMT8_BODSA|nr:Hypothetical protein, putative [Bodo saltans]|eukprot:CUE74587.1 Hypothetical protein, putative [Bodo saltans]
MLVCGHKCKGSCNTACRPCTEPCKYNCGHGTGCDKMSTANRHECGDCPNRNCQELCAWSCKHKQCSKRCNDQCDRVVCLEPCPEIITCPKGHKHRCLGVCGEQCPPFCRTCFVEHRQKNTVYDQRQSVATLEVDVMSEELDNLLLGTLIDEEFLKAVPESNTRLVFLPCCGGIVLAGDLDRHIQAVCSSNEIVPPKCFRCQSVIQPGYYKKQGSLLKKRHQEITEVQQHLLDKFDIVDEGVDGLIESLKSLAQRCVFGANFVLSDHEKDSEGAQWIDALEEYSGSEQPTKPILLKGKKGKRPSQDIEKRNAEVEEKWKKAKETLKALENAVIDKCPRRVRLDSGSPSAQRLIQTILELLRHLVQRKSTLDDNALKEARARVESIDALAHYLELR